MTDKLSSELASLRIDRAAPRKAAAGLGKWTWVMGSLAVALALAGGWVLLRERLFPVTVEATEITELRPGAAAVDLTATGYLVPQVVAKVGAKTVGRIAKTLVVEGQRVEQGAVLFELDPVDQATAVASAKARIAVAQARALTAKANLAEVTLQLERQRKLAGAGAAAPAVVDDLAAKVEALRAAVLAADADVAAARADANVASAALQNMTVVAPVTGTAVTKPAQVGDVVEPLFPLVELADFSTLMVEVDVPESRLGLVKTAAPAEVVLEALPHERLAGEVVEVSPRLNRAKATATVKVRVLERTDLLRPEMSARVSFLAKPLSPEERNAKPKVIAPKTAITERGGRKWVFVIDGDSVSAVPVEVGEDLGEAWVLRKGPGAGTRVVANPPPGLRAGRRIQEREES